MVALNLRRMISSSARFFARFAMRAEYGCLIDVKRRQLFDDRKSKTKKGHAVTLFKRLSGAG
jgi:hypothetical protein